MKSTGTAPFVVATEKEVLPTVAFFDSTVAVAVRAILLGVLLACVPRMVSAVVVVIFWLVAPFRKVADPLPMVVERVRVIGVVLQGGITVAVIVAVLPIGTTGVPEKVTLGGPTHPVPPGLSRGCDSTKQLFPLK